MTKTNPKNFFLKDSLGIREMDDWLRVQAVLPEDLSLIPSTSVKWLKMACNFSSRESDNLASVGTPTYCMLISTNTLLNKQTGELNWRFLRFLMIVCI